MPDMSLPMAAMMNEEPDALGAFRLVSPTRVQVLLDVSPRTVARLAKAGRLERVELGHRTVRYTAESVEALIHPATSEAPVITPGLRDNSGEDTADAPERT